MARKTKPSEQQDDSTSSPVMSSRTVSTPNSPQRQSSLKSLMTYDMQKAINILFVTALYAPLSQLILAPVYGSIPAATYNKYVFTAAPTLAFVLRGSLPAWVNKSIPMIAFWIPSIHFVLFKYSNQLDHWGPLLTELLTIFPLLTASIHVAMDLVADVEFPFLGYAGTGPPIVVSLLFSIFHRLMKGVLSSIIGWNVIFSRLGLQLAIGALYSVILPQSFFWAAAPSVAFTLFGNSHLPLQRNTEIANNTLALYNYTLLERRESVTGYLSVLQDNQHNFRVMRCDHSLLGGEWQFPAPKGVFRPVGEPIYPVFTMLEAVRLIGPPPSSPELPPISKLDADKRALAIGLGTGSAPSAFIAHGINTTILELDPVVHYFAGKYFNLPKNHSYYIGDAIDFVHDRAHQLAVISRSLPQAKTTYSKRMNALQYDYILHDTFTGGALPVPLFTRSSLQSLAALLKPTGVIAINYAGDLDLPSASLVYRTILSVFPRCRIYREDVESPKNIKKKERRGGSTQSSPSSSTTTKSTSNTNTTPDSNSEGPNDVYDGDFTNLVYFCLPPTAPATHTIKFRTATPADFLGSGARRHYMMPKHELDPIEKFGRQSQHFASGHTEAEAGVETKADRTGTDEEQIEVLDVNDKKAMKLVERYQAISAMGHWRLMRSVIPPEIWELW